MMYPLIGSATCSDFGSRSRRRWAGAVGTVYLKWAQVDADPDGDRGVAGRRRPRDHGGGARDIRRVAAPLAGSCARASGGGLSGVVGSGFVYLIWFDIVRRLPATTVSLGILSVPVVGVVSSMVMLGERPTVPDIIGFTLIFAAAALRAAGT